MTDDGAAPALREGEGEFDAEGRRHGPWRETDPHGGTIAGDYVHGERQGPWTHYFADGRVRSEMTDEDGELAGPTTWYRATGGTPPGRLGVTNRPRSRYRRRRRRRAGKASRAYSRVREPDTTARHAGERRRRAGASRVVSVRRTSPTDRRVPAAMAGVGGAGRRPTRPARPASSTTCGTLTMVSACTSC